MSRNSQSMLVGNQQNEKLHDIMNIRVFVSYAHHDSPVAAKVIQHLTDIGVRPSHDKGFKVTRTIANQVTSKIAYSHLVLAIITENSVNRAWVQQEIGFAFGVGLPVVCVAIGIVPQGMPSAEVALTLEADLSDLAQKLTIETLKDAVHAAQEYARPTFQCAYLSEERTKMLVEYAQNLSVIEHARKVRYWGAFTSFAIPDAEPTSKIWDEFEGTTMQRARAVRERLRQERQVLELHARSAGCDLIVDPYITSAALTQELKLARLKELRRFVDGMPENRVRLVVRHNNTEGNLLILGDWFYAESLSPQAKSGFLHTVFTQHAPSVLKKLEEFVKHFDSQYHTTATDHSSKKRDALKKLDECITEIASE